MNVEEHGGSVASILSGGLCSFWGRPRKPVRSGLRGRQHLLLFKHSRMELSSCRLAVACSMLLLSEKHHSMELPSGRRCFCCHALHLFRVEVRSRLAALL